MIFKLLTALAVAYLGWRAWHGWGRLPGSPKAAPPIAPGARGAVEEACALLEVAPDASESEIRSAHRRLVARVHPDRGGSAKLTRDVNEARDLLLRKREDTK